MSLLLWGVLSACTTRAPASDARPLTVFAASSLTEAFAELERGFEAQHPQVDVQLVFAGSQVLRMQIEQGATADLFASADERHMRALADQGLLGDVAPLAGNELVVIVPVGHPSAVRSFETLDRAERLVIGGDSVPVGRYTRALFEQARQAGAGEFIDRVEAAVVSEENNVRLVRAKVELGEADAAVVYRTDAVASDRVQALPIPDALRVRATYPIAVTRAARRPEDAAAFVAYARGASGQQVLVRHGFVAGAE